MSLMKTDIFPPLTEHGVEELDCHPNFKDLSTKCEIIPFIFYLDKQKIYYGRLPYDHKLQKHLVDVGTGLNSTIPNSRLNNWDLIDKRITLSIHEEKKNVDVRTSFKFQLNNFIVKKMFTTGQRKVEDGTHHIFQLYKADMKFYYLLPIYRHRVGIINRSFKKESQFAYNQKTMRAHEKYRIPEGTVYLVTAMQNSYFSIHVVKNNEELPFQCLNPMDEFEPSDRPNWQRADIYDQPPPTPAIELATSDRKTPSVTNRTFKIPKMPKLTSPPEKFPTLSEARPNRDPYAGPVSSAFVEDAPSDRPNWQNPKPCTVTSSDWQNPSTSSDWQNPSTSSDWQNPNPSTSSDWQNPNPSTSSDAANAWQNPKPSTSSDWQNLSTSSDAANAWQNPNPSTSSDWQNPKPSTSSDTVNAWQNPNPSTSSDWQNPKPSTSSDTVNETFVHLITNETVDAPIIYLPPSNLNTEKFISMKWYQQEKFMKYKNPRPGIFIENRNLSDNMQPLDLSVSTQPGVPANSTDTPGVPANSTDTVSPANAVDTPRVPTNAVDTPRVPANAVDTPRVPANAVDTPRVPANAVDTPRVPANAVDTPRVPANAVDILMNEYLHELDSFIIQYK